MLEDDMADILERQRLEDVVETFGRKDAAAWLALLRCDYSIAKSVGTRDAWMKLATNFRGAASLPPDQRRTEAHSQIQIDEARIKMSVHNIAPVFKRAYLGHGVDQPVFHPLLRLILQTLDGDRHSHISKIRAHNAS